MDEERRGEKKPRSGRGFAGGRAHGEPRRDFGQVLFSRNFSRSDGDDPAAFEGLGTQALGYGLVGAAVAAQPPARASAHVPADAAADGAQAVFEAGGALGGLVVKAGLVVVELDVYKRQ